MKTGNLLYGMKDLIVHIAHLERFHIIIIGEMSLRLVNTKLSFLVKMQVMSSP